MSLVASSAGTWCPGWSAVRGTAARSAAARGAGHLGHGRRAWCSSSRWSGCCSGAADRPRRWAPGRARRLRRGRPRAAARRPRGLRPDHRPRPALLLRHRCTPPSSCVALCAARRVLAGAGPRSASARCVVGGLAGVATASPRRSVRRCSCPTSRTRGPRLRHQPPRRPGRRPDPGHRRRPGARGAGAAAGRRRQPATPSIFGPLPELPAFDEPSARLRVVGPDGRAPAGRAGRLGAERPGPDDDCGYAVSTAPDGRGARGAGRRPAAWSASATSPDAEATVRVRAEGWTDEFLARRGPNEVWLVLPDVPGARDRPRAVGDGRARGLRHRRRRRASRRHREPAQSRDAHRPGRDRRSRSPCSARCWSARATGCSATWSSCPTSRGRTPGSASTARCPAPCRWTPSSRSLTQRRARRAGCSGHSCSAAFLLGGVGIGRLRSSASTPGTPALPRSRCFLWNPWVVRAAAPSASGRSCSATSRCPGSCSPPAGCATTPRRAGRAAAVAAHRARGLQPVERGDGGRWCSPCSALDAATGGARWSPRRARARGQPALAGAGADRSDAVGVTADGVFAAFARAGRVGARRCCRACSRSAASGRRRVLPDERTSTVLVVLVVRAHRRRAGRPAACGRDRPATGAGRACARWVALAGRGRRAPPSGAGARGARGLPGRCPDSALLRDSHRFLAPLGARPGGRASPRPRPRSAGGRCRGREALWSAVALLVVAPVAAAAQPGVGAHRRPAPVVLPRRVGRRSPRWSADDPTAAGRAPVGGQLPRLRLERPPRGPRPGAPALPGRGARRRPDLLDDDVVPGEDPRLARRHGARWTPTSRQPALRGARRALGAGREAGTGRRGTCLRARSSTTATGCGWSTWGRGFARPARGQVIGIRAIWPIVDRACRAFALLLVPLCGSVGGKYVRRTDCVRVFGRELR